MTTKEVYEVIEQDEDVRLPIGKKKTKSTTGRDLKPVEIDNTDKPALLLSKLSNDTKEQLTRDSKEILHGFHLNGRNADSIRNRTKEILKDATKTKLLLVKAPKVEEPGELQLMNTLYVKWSETLFGFLEAAKPAGDHLAFIKDVKTGHIYMPCCHDVKPIAQNQLLNHFVGCLASKIDGSKCAFCNSTDLTNNTYTTVNSKKEHIMQNTHLNSIYQVLEYTTIGLAMVDARIVEQYITVRPFSNYFLKQEVGCFAYNNFLTFLQAHMPVQQFERTPIYSTLKMYQRIAKNKGKTSYTLPCIDCDTTLPTYTGFYLGKILSLEKVDCVCGEGSGYILPLKDIDTIYDLVQQLAKKDGSTAAKSMLLDLFTTQDQNTSSKPLNLLNFDLDEMLKKSTTNLKKTIIVGKQSNCTDDAVQKLSSSTITATPPVPAPRTTSILTTIGSPQNASDGSEPAIFIRNYDPRAAKASILSTTTPRPPESNKKPDVPTPMTAADEYDDGSEDADDALKIIYRTFKHVGPPTDVPDGNKRRKVTTGTAKFKDKMIKTTFRLNGTFYIPTVQQLISHMNYTGTQSILNLLETLYTASVNVVDCVDEVFIAKIFGLFTQTIANNDISQS